MMASDDEWANEEWNEDTLTLVPDIKSMCINDKAKKNEIKHARSLMEALYVVELIQKGRDPTYVPQMIGMMSLQAELTNMKTAQFHMLSSCNALMGKTWAPYTLAALCEDYRLSLLVLKHESNGRITVLRMDNHCLKVWHRNLALGRGTLSSMNTIIRNWLLVERNKSSRPCWGSESMTPRPFPTT